MSAALHHVVIVEPDRLLGDALRYFFKELGMNPICISSSQIIDSSVAPSLVVMNGACTASSALNLKKPDGENVPVILFDIEGNDLRNPCPELNVQFLRTPFSPKDLRDCVRQIFG